jgi:hypothetical protein
VDPDPDSDPDPQHWKNRRPKGLKKETRKEIQRFMFKRAGYFLPALIKKK